VLQPGRASEQPREPSSSPSPSPSSSPSPEPASEAPPTDNQIQAITFVPERSALQVRASGTLSYEMEQEGSRYRIRFPNTQLGNLPPVDLAFSSRLLGLEWDQDGEDAVVDLQVAPDVQVGPPVADSAGFRQRGSNQITVPLVRPFWQPSRELPPVSLPDIGDRRPIVVLDPGHGGRDPGAVGIRSLREVDIVNTVSFRVRELLEQEGVRVVMTRSDNRTLELEQRVQVAERANANLFVSIHANAISMSRPDVNGMETFHTSAQGRVLATALLNSMLEATGSPSRGVKTARFYVIRNTSMPSALVEMGFVTGAEDAPRMETAEYRELLARAIARGILLYIRENR
jgi:N-acetylmuramoyl-L-alanine amidase